MLAIGEHTRNKEFTDKYNVIEIPSDESYGVNCIRMNDYVVMPEGFPKTKKYWMIWDTMCWRPQ